MGGAAWRQRAQHRACYRLLAGTGSQFPECSGDALSSSLSLAGLQCRPLRIHPVRARAMALGIYASRFPATGPCAESPRPWSREAAASASTHGQSAQWADAGAADAGATSSASAPQARTTTSFSARGCRGSDCVAQALGSAGFRHVGTVGVRECLGHENACRQ